MKLLFVAIFFFFVSTTLVESFLISALIGFKIGYLVANANRGRGRSYGRSYGHRRWGRSIEASDESSIQLEQIMLQASLEDNDDCAKAFVCHVSANPALVSPVEQFVSEYFGTSSKDQAMFKSLMPKEASQGLTIVDALSPTVQFDLAAQIGKIGGPQQCKKIYAQCPLPYHELLSVIEGKSTTTN